MGALIVVQPQDGVLLADSRGIADALGIEHRTLLQTIDKYGDRIEAEFGRLTFEMFDVPVPIPNTDTFRIDQSRVAHLTEEQALFVGTLSRNTDRVITFKAELIKAFSKARNLIDQAVVNLPVTREQRLALALLDANAVLEETKQQLEEARRELQEQATKLDYVDEVLNTNECVAIWVIASELGYSAVKFNQLLQQLGVQHRVSGSWLLTAKYRGQGYTRMKTHVYYDSKGKPHSREYTVWTQRGRAFLHQLIKEQQPQRLLE